MILNYPNKISESKFLELSYNVQPTTNFLYEDKLLLKGENLNVMKFLLANGYSGKIDLVYIDPPFATNNVFTIGENKVRTISSKKDNNIAYSDKIIGHDFIEFIRLRLILLRELLSEKGSIYIHTDYKIGQIYIQLFYNIFLYLFIFIYNI